MVRPLPTLPYSCSLYHGGRRCVPIACLFPGCGRLTSRTFGLSGPLPRPRAFITNHRALSPPLRVLTVSIWVLSRLTTTPTTYHYRAAQKYTQIVALTNELSHQVTVNLKPSAKW